MAAPYWALFAQNNSTYLSTLGQRTNLKLRELSPLLIVHNIAIS